jgi:hypothetical protein
MSLSSRSLFMFVVFAASCLMLSGDVISFLTLCRRATYKDVIAKPCVVDGSRISCFHGQRRIPASVGCPVSYIASTLLAALSRMSGCQITNTLTLSNLTFAESYDCNKATTERENLCILFRKLLRLRSWLWVGV